MKRNFSLTPLLLGAFLLFLQLWLILLGGGMLGKYWNPVLLFLVSIGIAWYYLFLHLRKTAIPDQQLPVRISHSIAWILGAMLIFFLSYEEWRKVMVVINPEEVSDVVTQALVLFDRFEHGVFPYTAIRIKNAYDLEPIYMPFQWLPIGLAKPFDLDIRWIGFGFLMLAFGFLGWGVSRINKPAWIKVLVLFAATSTFWAWIMWTNLDITGTYEMVTGAYYLFLAAALLSRNIWLIVAGIILCLISRYTLLFWLPLFALLLYMAKGMKWSIRVWSIIGIAVLVLFVIPFYLKDPEFMVRAYAYYHRYTVSEWSKETWTDELGVSAAVFGKKLCIGSPADCVSSVRTVQLTILLFIIVAGWYLFKKWRDRIDLYSLSLIALYLSVFCLLFFAPLIFRYYYFSLTLISGIVCCKIMMFAIPGRDPLIQPAQ